MQLQHGSNQLRKGLSYVYQSANLASYGSYNRAVSSYSRVLGSYNSMVNHLQHGDYQGTGHIGPVTSNRLAITSYRTAIAV